MRVGDHDAPPLATPDPAILTYLSETGRALVTQNRRSMMEHYAEHMMAGNSHWGVFVVSRRLSLSTLAAEIELLWETSEAEEWGDRWVNLPL